MQLAVSALKEIGEGKATDEELIRLKEVVSGVPSAMYDHDMTLAPAWIRKTFVSLKAES